MRNATATRQSRCPECRGTIPVGAPIVPAVLGPPRHRGCANPDLVRRPARARVSFPQWAQFSMFFFALGGLFATTQVAAYRLVAVFGPHQASTLGTPIAGRIRNPFQAMGATLRVEWMCEGVRVVHKTVVTPTSPTPPGTPAAPTPSLIDFAWGSGCAPATRQALSRGVTLPVVGTLGLTIIGVFALWLFGLLVSSGTARIVRRVPAVPDSDDPRFRLYVGRATGRFARLGHGASIACGSPVVLTGDDAAQNIVIFGSIGSGKTTYAMNRFVEQSLEQDCGTLVYDVKGDYGETVRALARKTGRTVVRIGVGGQPCNLLAGLTPETAASFLKSAILLLGNTSPQSAFWTNTATDLVTAVLGLLVNFPERYSLRGLYESIFKEAERAQLHRDVEALRARLIVDFGAAKSDEVARLDSYRQYLRFDFPNFDDKVQDGARSQLSQAIRIFSLPEIDQAFCRAGEGVLSMEELLNGGVFLLDLPLAKYGLGAKTVYTMVKLRFFNVMARRRVERDWNQTRPIVFICDEYQELISVAKEGLSDRNFWDKSRSSRCIGIISGQGVESFRAAIGDLGLTHSLLQNFRQKIAFRTEDELTLRYFSYVPGNVEVEFEQHGRSQQRGIQVNTRGTTWHETVRTEPLINPQLFRRLDRGEAVCLLSIDGAAYDDVLTMEPRFIVSQDDNAPRVAAEAAL